MQLAQLSRCNQWANVECVLIGGQSGDVRSEATLIRGAKWRAGSVEHFMVGTSLQLGFIKKIQLNYTNPGMNELVIESVITLK